MTDNKKNLGIEIFQPVAPEHFVAARELFREYTNFLYSLPDMRAHVDSLDPHTEIAGLEAGPYASPTGAMLLATCDKEYTGVVALRRLTDRVCEMKRLYVRRKYRGVSIGIQLVRAIIRKGKALGYERMRLDSHPDMTKAHQLYYSLGFYDIPRYNKNIVPGVLFMELDLDCSGRNL